MSVEEEDLKDLNQLDSSVDVVARRLIKKVLDEIDFSSLRKLHSEFLLDDWSAVVDRVSFIVADQMAVDEDTYWDAVEYLQERQRSQL